MEVKPDTASDFYLKAKGHLENKEIDKSKSESKDTVRIIPNKISNIQNIDTKKKIKISKKNNYRVPVQYPDGKPGMPL